MRPRPQPMVWQSTVVTNTTTDNRSRCGPNTPRPRNLVVGPCRCRFPCPRLYPLLTSHRARRDQPITIKCRPSRSRTCVLVTVWAHPDLAVARHDTIHILPPRQDRLHPLYIHNVGHLPVTRMMSVQDPTWVRRKNKWPTINNTTSSQSQVPTVNIIIPNTDTAHHLLHPRLMPGPLRLFRAMATTRHHTAVGPLPIPRD